MVAATVEALLGNYWGTATLVSGAVQGVGVELAFASSPGAASDRPSRCSAGSSPRSSRASSSCSLLLRRLDPRVPIVYIGSFAVSGALVAGLGGWALTRALARTGALSAFPAGREHRG